MAMFKIREGRKTVLAFLRLTGELASASWSAAVLPPGRGCVPSVQLACPDGP